MLFSVLGGILAGAVFKRLWKAYSGEKDPPKAKESEYGWKEVLPAALLQGAILGAREGGHRPWRRAGLRALDGDLAGRLAADELRPSVHELALHRVDGDAPEEETPRDEHAERTRSSHPSRPNTASITSSTRW